MDMKPEDFKKMSEFEKQEVFTDELERLYENFVAEYEMSEISVIGVFTMFTNALMFSYQKESEEENEQD